jgi:DNA (cytosine-5)-methyltransferase 1
MDKTINSFFAGFGGFDLGFTQAGFTVVGAWDNDPYAVKSYAHNLGDHIELADITTMKGANVPYASGWLFGFPCTDVSQAGRKAGMIKGETRTGLFYEVMRLLGEVGRKPEWILAENVMGLAPYLDIVEHEYKQAGYRMVYTSYNSKFWGVAQSRQRFFILGIREDLTREFKFPEEQHEFVPKLWSILESEVEERFYIPEGHCKSILEQLANKHAAKGEAFSEEGIRVVGRLDIKGHDLIKRVYDPEGLSPTLNTVSGGNQQPKVLIELQKIWTDKDGCSYCIDANYWKGISPKQVMNSKRTQVVESIYRIRKLTPRETARLQGFSDTYEQVVSNSRFYRGMGNAVSVPVAYAIAKAIKEQL